VPFGWERNSDKTEVILIIFVGQFVGHLVQHNKYTLQFVRFPNHMYDLENFDGS
jgi:hypothetical protein